MYILKYDFFKKDFIYLFDRERHSKKGDTAGGVGEGEAGFPWSREPNAGLYPRTPRSWPEPKADSQLTEHPGAPICSLFHQLWISSQLNTICKKGENLICLTTYKQSFDWGTRLYKVFLKCIGNPNQICNRIFKIQS